MTIGAQFATIAYVETMRRNLMLAISGAGVTALPPASEGGEGAESFLGLDDTPDSYVGYAGSIPTVAAAEDALEFSPYVLIDPAAPIITVRNMSDGDVDLVHKWASGATPVVKFSDGLDLTDGNYVWCNTDGLVDTTTGGTGWGASLIVCDYTNNRVKQHLASTLAYSSQVASAGAHRVCTDGTNYYVSDATNHQVRKYLIATNALLWTVGTQGSGDDQFDSPQGIDTDGTYLYICDKANRRIKKHLCSTGAYVAKIGSYGSALGQFITPTGICTDGTYLYITEGSPGAAPLLKKHLCSDLSGVDQISADGHLDSTNCQDICTDGASLYLVNANNDGLNSIFKYTRALVYVSEYGTLGSGDAQFAGPYGICTDKTYLYVTDTGNARIKKHLVSDYSYVAKIGSDGIGDDNFKSPRGICVGYLGEPRTGRLLRLRQDGTHFEVWPKLDLYNHLVFREDSALATDYVALKAPSAITASYELTLPPADAAGALTSDGAGTLSFTAVCPLGAKYIVQEADATLTAEQSLGALATGILKNTTTGSTGVLSIAVGTDLPAHVLDSAVHSVSGLTTGHFLKATGAATFGFAAHGLTASDVAAEPALGNPGVDDYVLSSKTDGTRSWVAAGGGGGAPTDAQYVCLAVNGSLSAERVLTGTANQITITDNGANGTVVLSTPQDIHTGAGPTFDHLHIGSTATVTTSSTELILEETGDTFGTIRIRLRNRSGTNGMLLEDPSLDLIDLCFLPSTNKQQNIRLEGRSAYFVNANNTRGEFQFTDPDLGAIWFATGVGGTNFKEGNVGINDAAPAEKLDVNGNINVTGVYKVDDVALAAADVGAEPALGNPDVDGKVLSSTAAGVRSWIAAGGALALDDLTDVDASAPSDNDILRFDTASGTWMNEALPAAANHDLMSATHADTTAGAVVRGDIITAQGASPTWKALAKGTEGYVLTMGADEPGWAASAASGAPADAKYIVGAANASLSAEKVKPQLYNNYDIDDTPASPNALDDEFDDSSLDVKWTIVNDPASPNAVSETAFPGYVWVGAVEHTSTDNFDSAIRLYQAAPAGNALATYIAKVALGAVALESTAEVGEWGTVCIYLGNSTDDEFVLSAFQLDNAQGAYLAGRVRLNINGASGSWAAGTFDNYQTVPSAQFVYLKLEKATNASYTSANTYNAYYSLNGIVWYHIGQHAKTFTHDVNEVGIIIRRPKAQGGSPVVHAIVDFFRRTV